MGVRGGGVRYEVLVVIGKVSCRFLVFGLKMLEVVYFNFFKLGVVWLILYENCIVIILLFCRYVD